MSAISSAYRTQSLDARTGAALAWLAAALLAGLALIVFAAVQFAASMTALPDDQFPQRVLSLIAAAAGGVILWRYIRRAMAVITRQDYRRARDTMRADLIQLFLIAVLITVIFPLLWILSMSLDPRDYSRPSGLTIIPPGATLNAYI